MLFMLLCQHNAEGCVMHDRFIIFFQSIHLIVSCGVPVVVHVSGSAEERNFFKRNCYPKFVTNVRRDITTMV